MTDDIERSPRLSAAPAVSDDRTPCVACREPILTGARRCPHCHAPQRPEKVKFIASTLKWIGGITAVISLVIGSASVHELYESWQERRAAIAEHVAAAQLQLDSRDYAGGWASLNQALQLDPASGLARRFQVPFALEWLRNARVGGDEDFASIVDPLLPVLYRGAADAPPAEAATLYAHIGWGNFLKRRDGNTQIAVLSFLDQALALDPGNPYASTFYGHLIVRRLTSYGDRAAALEKAWGHFDTALKGDIDKAYVANMALSAYFGAPRRDSARHALRFADRMRTENVEVSPRHRKATASLYDGLASRDTDFAEGWLASLGQALTPEALRKTFLWAVDVARPANRTRSQTEQFVQGRLAELTGDRATARETYRALAASLPERSDFRQSVVVPALVRVSDPK